MNPTHLHSASLGWPITRLDVSFFPVFLPDARLPAILTGAGTELQVEELEKASVGALRMRNPHDKPVLVVAGEHFLGGKQNRAVNVSVLVPSLGEIEVPVSCLEEGRWGRARSIRRHDSLASRSVRARMEEGVHRSAREEQSFRGDQGAVWREVQSVLSEAGVPSETAAEADYSAAQRHRAPERFKVIEDLAGQGPLPGQCGVVVTHGSWVIGMDLFGAPELLAAHWAALIRSHLLERPRPNGPPSPTRALGMLRRYAALPSTEKPGLGLGVEHRMKDHRLSGFRLALNDTLVHGTFFTPPPRAHH